MKRISECASAVSACTADKCQAVSAAADTQNMRFTSLIQSRGTALSIAHRVSTNVPFGGSADPDLLWEGCRGGAPQGWQILPTPLSVRGQNLFAMASLEERGKGQLKEGVYFNSLSVILVCYLRGRPKNSVLGSLDAVHLIQVFSHFFWGTELPEH